MDAFVHNKLTEWGLKDWITTFQEEEVDTYRLYRLEEHEIGHMITKVGPRAKFKKRLKELKSQQKCDKGKCNEQKFEEAASCIKDFPCTSMCGKDDVYCGTEEVILNDVKRIMTSVEAKLSEDTELSRFLKNEINNLKIDKREMVGVFGQTGAGKSSLINAVIGEKDLLPTGSLTACTTVMIKVEANTQSKKYEAEIEFITEMEWKDELWSVTKLYGDINHENEDDDEYNDIIEKLTAFYGDNWKSKSFEMLMEPKYFREIPEFLHSVKKKVQCKSAKELMEKMARYIRSDSNDGNNKESKRFFWPLVKCVTVRVPDNDLPKHVTLVDLPGNGDRNKSRDQMWRQIIGSCSTVWIVTNMNRAAADKDAWEILTSACGLMENGGICQNIHFICTKTDVNVEERPATEVRHYILEKNLSAKRLVKNEIKKQRNLKTHLGADCFEVFTVSSKEFLKAKYLQPNETEIPKLREFLQCLNELHGQTLNYVSGARRILSLMNDASCGHMALQQTQLRVKLDQIIKCKLLKVRTTMHDAYMILDQCLTKGVENSRHFCQGILKKQIQRESGSAFHTTLKCLVENNGVHRPKHGEMVNLNSKLSSFLMESINEDFRKVFPNDGKSGHFYGVIHEFSLGTILLVQQHRALELQLLFLRTEEEKIKTRLIKIIQNRRKMIYSSLTQTVEETMQECYKKAATFSGKGSLEKMRHTIEAYVQDVKDTMFDQAKDDMLRQLKELMEDVLKILGETLQKSVELSLRVDNSSIPDISTEFGEVMKHYNKLMSIEGEADLLLSDSEMEIS